MTAMRVSFAGMCGSVVKMVREGVVVAYQRK
jgi:hypothetical protein